MAALTFRNPVILKTNAKIGSSGTAVTKLLAGVVSTCVPAIGASTVGTGSAYIDGLAAGDFILAGIATIGASGVGVLNVRATAANTASFSFFSMGATTASTMDINYIAFDS